MNVPEDFERNRSSHLDTARPRDTIVGKDLRRLGSVQQADAGSVAFGTVGLPLLLVRRTDWVHLRKTVAVY